MTNEERLIGVLNGAVRIEFESGDAYHQDEFGWHHDKDLMTDSPDDFARADKAVDVLNELSTMFNLQAHPLTGGALRHSGGSNVTQTKEEAKQVSRDNMSYGEKVALGKAIHEWQMDFTPGSQLSNLVDIGAIVHGFEAGYAHAMAEMAEGKDKAALDTEVKGDGN